MCQPAGVDGTPANRLLLESGDCVSINEFKWVLLKNDIPAVRQQDVVKGVSVSPDNVEREKKSFQHDVQRVTAQSYPLRSPGREVVPDDCSGKGSKYFAASVEFPAGIDRMKKTESMRHFLHQGAIPLLNDQEYPGRWTRQLNGAQEWLEIRFAVTGGRGNDCIHDLHHNLQDTEFRNQ